MAAFIDWQKLLNGVLSGEAGSSESSAGSATGNATRSKGAPSSGLSARNPPAQMARRAWNPDLQLTVTTAGVAGLLALLVWWWQMRRNRSKPPTPIVMNGRKQTADAAAAAVSKALNDRIDSFEERFQRALIERMDSFEGRFQKSLDQQAEATVAAGDRFQKALDQQTETTEGIEDRVQKSLGDKIDTIEESLSRVHRALSSRLEALEGLGQKIDALEEGVKELDSKQLDQEAMNIMQRGVRQRIETAEESLRSLDNRSRSYSQRIESLDDSVRVMDSRTKSISQRVEVVEDNFNTLDGQQTLMAHDMSRGSIAVEKLQRQVKMLPDDAKFRSLSRAWEARFKKIDGKIDHYKSILDEENARREEERIRQEEERARQEAEALASLTLSHVETQEIEPAGTIYTHPFSTPYKMMFDGPMPPTPSPSVRSYSASSEHSSSPTIPYMSSRGRTDGFRDSTFSARQKMLAASAQKMQCQR